MKTTIFSLGLVLSLMACTKETTVNYALFSGKIENVEAKEITLVKSDKSFSKKITLESSGIFMDTIKNNPGLYSFTIGKNKTNLYLNNGDVLNITANAKDFTGTLKVAGKGVETTNYLLFKNKKTRELTGGDKSFYALEEVDFKNKSRNINTILNNVLDTIKGIDPAFKTLERRNLNYTYLLRLSRYVTGKHAYWAKRTGYKPSEGFLDELKALDINNEKEFLVSNIYKQLVIAHYVDKIRALAKKDSIDFMIAKVKVHAAIPNEIIKNDLIFSGAEYGIVKAESFEDYYKIFMNASTNKENNAKITELYNKLSKLNKGQPSPKFVNYENNAGGTLSLDDLKGKYTYIDIWATWCGPCIREIPDLKRVEKAYHGKNIQFLSISIDESKDYDKWKEMIVAKELGGIQVIADSAASSQFAKEYFITSIPRFILLDPEGKIVAKKAPRPSSPELITLLNELNI
ncbi:TlpA family protein disulfide reductase [Lutibacter sp. A80]|uniref:TlpA family protein disulfide reductase n=1 Tax=Lutibacter sp. A80 TaxID=2918453 RepID=UPI001F05DF56|nr:TlpA disulfide reductase family protein [Lutibacter sp. A80]UMB60812.1 TlpA family protein disulfide reductase [Lutibacter sp. A80]